MKRAIFFIIFYAIFSTPLVANPSYERMPAVKRFISRMHRKYAFDEAYLRKLFSKAVHQEETLARYRGRRGKTDFSWHRYRSKILIPESVAMGRAFMKRNRKWLKKAQRLYGVSPQIVTAFIRVESKFGLYGGEYRVWDSLVTLAFNENRKRDYFRYELEKLLVLAARERLDILKLKGSFAGAMGAVQQMPSIQLKYAVDLDGDGVKNPSSIADSIGSIANFLHDKGWRDGRRIVCRAKYTAGASKTLKGGLHRLYEVKKLQKSGIAPLHCKIESEKAYLISLRDGGREELYLGSRNYRIITLYNHSARYAVTIALYAEALGY